MRREIWRPIPGADGYEVSNRGRVRSLDRVIYQRIGWGPTPDRIVARRMKGKMFKLGLSASGYQQAAIPPLRRGPTLVQHLVAMAFLDPKPEGELIVLRHRDDVKTNNHDTNLVWGTEQDNHDDARENGRVLRGERRPNARLLDVEAAAIKGAPRHVASSELARVFGLSASRIGEIRRHERWSHVPALTPERAMKVIEQRQKGEP